jgi:hypothetical protein
LNNNVATLLLYEAGGVVKESNSNATQSIASNSNMMKLLLE